MASFPVEALADAPVSQGPHQCSRLGVPPGLEWRTLSGTL